MKLSERFARVRAKKPAAPAPAAPAPAKRSRKYGFTYGELDAAISAACADMGDCSTRRTLMSFSGLVQYGHDNDIVTFTGSAPASCVQLDEALADLQNYSVPAGTLHTLKRVRALLVHAASQKAKEPVQYVTVAQLKAFEAAVFDTIGWLGGFVAAELNRGQPSQAHLQNMLARSANTPGRRKALDAFGAFDESKVPQRTQAEWLRYQSSGHW